MLRALLLVAMSCEAAHAGPDAPESFAAAIHLAIDAPAASLPIPMKGDLASTPTTLRLRNTGARTVSALRLFGGPDFTSREAILAAAYPPGTDDQMRAEALWRLMMDNVYHYFPASGSEECHDPVKLLNVYGYGFCDDSAKALASLWIASGLQARVWDVSGHVIPEVFYGGAWHMYDPDLRMLYQRPGSDHVLGVEELAADPAFVAAAPAALAPPSVLADLYGTTKNNSLSPLRPSDHQLAFALYPGESLYLFEGGGGEAFRVIFRKEKPPPRFAHAIFDFSLAEFRRSAGIDGDILAGLAFRPGGSESAAEGDYVADPAKGAWGRLVYRRGSPFVLVKAAIVVDARLRDPDCHLDVLLGGPGGAPRKLLRTVAGPFDGLLELELPKRPITGSYDYSLEIRLRGGGPGDAVLRDFRATTTAQASSIYVERVLSKGGELHLRADAPVTAEFAVEWTTGLPEVLGFD